MGESVKVPRPAFSFGPLSRDHVRQTTFGVAYDGRWKDLGEISFSLSRADCLSRSSARSAPPRDMQLQFRTLRTRVLPQRAIRESEELLPIVIRHVVRAGAHVESERAVERRVVHAGHLGRQL